MWEPIIASLPADRHCIAFDLPGHGSSPMTPGPGLAAAVEALHTAVTDAAIEAPIMVGHSIGGPIATLYAASHPSAGVVGIEAPLRLEPFAEMLLSLREQLSGPGFPAVWEGFRESFGMELLSAERRAFLRERPSQQLVLAYQYDLLERPLADVVRWRDEALRRLRQQGTPYLALLANPVVPSERAWLADRLPQAETVVWPVGHHFPHLEDPDRFAAVLTGFAAGRG